MSTLMDHPIFAMEGSPAKIMRAIPRNQWALVFPHSFSVKNWAGRIADCLGFDAFFISLVRKGALYHDLGKFHPGLCELFFGQPSEEFTKEQAEHAGAHAYASATLLQRYKERFLGDHASYVRIIAIIVSGHHWSYQESTELYSKKIAQGQFRYGPMDDMGDFPLEATRILKVADSFAAATENRPYKKNPPLSREEAFRDILSRSGTEYCPQAVEGLRLALQRVRKKEINEVCS